MAQPTSLEARCEVASSCVARLDLTIPTVVDGLDDRVSRLYGAWPERLYVVDAQGEVSYKGAMGPFGFEPDEVREHLLDHFDLEPRQP